MPAVLQIFLLPYSSFLIQTQLDRIKQEIRTIIKIQNSALNKLRQCRKCFKTKCLTSQCFYSNFIPVINNTVLKKLYEITIKGGNTMLEIFQQLGINMAEHLEMLSQLDLSSLSQELTENISQISKLNAGSSSWIWAH